MTKTLSVKTSAHSEFVDITSLTNAVVREAGIKDGICLIFIPHTTCGITINENADPDVRRDMIMELDKMVPWKNGYHHLEGNSAAHIKSSMMGFSTVVPVSNSCLLLGTWQGLYLCEFDGPRTRNVIVQVQ
ncbi:MAG: secondary thiamine-phosphate synthase enzyme YjbQ [Spirochaetales bacterium]|nr:secondary thiamine-phosphate synthase enzyme YjbQ [Spirochaetales bacterium]